MWVGVGGLCRTGAEAHPPEVPQVWGDQVKP